MKKVLFAMIETGGGHKAPAKAVMEALRDNQPDRYELKLIDFYLKIDCPAIDR